MKQNVLLIYLLILLANTVHAQIIVPNSSFEEAGKIKGTKTGYWKAESDNFECRAEKGSAYKGDYSLKVSASAHNNYFFMQEFNFTCESIRKYKLRCAVKTDKMIGKAKLGARVFDKEGNTISLCSFTITESTDQEWQIAEGIFVAEEEAAKLRVFGQLSGTGTVWFDDVIIEEVPLPQKNPTERAQLYIHDYFDYVYNYSIISDKNFIAQLKQKTMYLCADSVGMNECRYILQQYTTRKLNDGHSFFTTAEEWKDLMEEGKHPNGVMNMDNLPKGKMTADKIAYIQIPMFTSSDKGKILVYAQTLENLVAEFDKQNPAGWIIDLADNGGGNCFPMIAGIGPLIGNGVCGYSFSGDGTIQKYIYDGGKAGKASEVFVQIDNPYILKNPGKRIAVIYGAGTASSGEVTAIAFIGLHNTRSFGQATAGATTRVDNFEMEDGAYLNLAAGINADRNQNKFAGSIKPDVATKDKPSALEAATMWILKEK